MENANRLAGAVEYINCISAKRYDFPNECPGYHIKQYDGEVPFIAIHCGPKR